MTRRAKVVGKRQPLREGLTIVGRRLGEVFPNNQPWRGYKGREVNKVECAECGAVGEVYIHSRCHIRSPTWAVLSADGRTVRIICAECKKPITTFNLKENDTHGRAKVS